MTTFSNIKRYIYFWSFPGLQRCTNNFTLVLR